MFRLLSFAVCLFVGVAVFGQSGNSFHSFRELDRMLDRDLFDVRSRSRFASQVFGDGALEKLDSDSLRFSRRLRLGGGGDVPASPPLAERERKPSATTIPSVNVPLQADVADPRSPPIRRPVVFFQRPGVLERNGALDEPSAQTLREQRWFRDPVRSEAGTPETGAGRGAIAVGGEETFRSAPIAQPVPLLAANPEQVRRKFEEKLEETLLSDPRVHFLSPVQISLNGNVATVRGIVPNQTHKIAVGNILLSDPAVRQVNNMISVVPLDPSKNPPPIELE